MIKQLITITITLLIQNAPKAIYYTCTIFDFTMLAQYLLYNNEILLYIEHTLYRLDKTKVIFQNCFLIDTKLFQLIFNYPKFYVIIYFVY